MRKATTLCLFLVLCFSGSALAQQTVSFGTAPSAALNDAFTAGRHNGVRGLSGPFDLDKDGKKEFLLAEYSGGGRAHVIENQGVGKWEVVYSTPVLDSTSYDRNGRYATVGDLDGDGKNEIILTAGNRYSATNPRKNLYKIGVYVFEHTGKDNDYGNLPASIFTFEDDANKDVGPPSDLRLEVFDAVDVDKDGKQELLLAANGPGSWDYFFAYSVDGDFQANGAGSTFET